MRPLLKGDIKADGGPFEDLMGLMVVSVGVAILLASLANAFLSFEQSLDEPEDLLEDFVYALRNYDKLQPEGAGQGIFSTEKLGSLNATLVALDLNAGCEFRIEFKEAGSYTGDRYYTTQTEELPDLGTEEILFRTTPVGLASGGFVHAGTMTVAIWGYER